MPRHWSEHDTPEALRGHSERLYALERPQGDPDEDPPLREVTFAWSGIVVASRSPRWAHPDGALITGVLVQVDVPGSTATVVRVLRNGSMIASVSVPAGANRAEWLGAGSGIGREDWLNAEVVTAGHGAESLTVQVRFR